MTTTFPLPLLENRTHSLRWIKQGPRLVHGSCLLRSNLCPKTGMLRSFIDEVRVKLGLQERRRNTGRGAGQSQNGKWHK